jgi:hypothetical protein
LEEFLSDWMGDNIKMEHKEINTMMRTGIIGSGKGAVASFVKMVMGLRVP